MPYSSPARVTILVADDSALNRELLSEILSREGYRVVTATDGSEALRVIRQQPVDLVLLDVVMPGSSGFEVCSSIKLRPETRFIPVILVTGLTSVNERIEGIKAGADDFLSKPVDKEETPRSYPLAAALKRVHRRVGKRGSRVVQLGTQH